MKLFAIDDEKASLYFLEKAIKEVCKDDELKTFLDADEFLKEFKKELPDIVFLDIEMIDTNGIDLAKKLISIKNDLNIVFVTAYKEYAIDAFNLNASSYIVKPANKTKVLNALNHLRYPINLNKDIVIKTFGNFDIFYKGEPVKFRSNNSKEILAYLVDRQGSLVSKKEIAGIIFEDDYSRTVQSTLSRNIQYLQEDLKNAGIENLFYSDNGYYVDLSNVSCDLIDFNNGNHDLYKGEYMEQYAFSEYRKYLFEK